MGTPGCSMKCPSYVGGCPHIILCEACRKAAKRRYFTRKALLHSLRKRVPGKSDRWLHAHDQRGWKPA